MLAVLLWVLRGKYDPSSPKEDLTWGKSLLSAGPQAHHRVDAPPAHAGAELGLTAAQAGKLADNREAHAGPAVAAPGSTPETFEDPSQLLAAQTRTLVEHVH